MLDPRDAEFLLNRPEFRRFLLSAIQSAGICGHYHPANGQSGRDLGHFEGRRSLGFDLLTMIHAGQPEAVREADPRGLATLALILREALSIEDTIRERDTDNASPRRGFRQHRADCDDSAGGSRYRELPSSD